MNGGWSLNSRRSLNGRWGHAVDGRVLIGGRGNRNVRRKLVSSVR